jgi:hypothetical protein
LAARLVKLLYGKAEPYQSRIEPQTKRSFTNFRYIHVHLKRLLGRPDRDGPRPIGSEVRLFKSKRLQVIEENNFKDILKISKQKFIINISASITIKFTVNPVC